MTFGQKISIIKAELQKPLPGREQHYLMAPEFRGISPSPAAELRKAAVMICIFPELEDLNIVLFKRSDYDGPHGGQVSFPGGVYEITDLDLAETAIRETKEEIGLNCDKSSIIGSLTPLTIPVSNMSVQPFVGFYNRNPVFTIEKREVDFLIVAKISALLDPSNICKEKWKLHGK